MRYAIIPVLGVGLIMCTLLAKFLHAIEAGPEVYSAFRVLFMVMAASGLAGLLALVVRGH